jgi:hypothetical protein
MNDAERKDSEPPKGRFAAFWTSLPGVLTAAAAFIGALAAVLALFVGGGDSGDGGGDSGSSRAEWAAKVNPICSNATDAIRRIPVDESPDFSEAANYLHQVGGIVRDLAEQIRTVPAPVEEQGNIDRMTLLVDKQADLADQAANSILAGDQAGLTRATKDALAAQREANTLAASLSVTACAQVVQANFTI